MKGILTSIFLLVALTSHAQWDVIHASGNNGGHRDLYFLNNDSGFVIGRKQIVSTENLETGVYLVKCYSENIVEAFKFIKL